MVVSIRTVLLKKRIGPYWISRNTGNFFCFNSSLSNLYNNVIIYTIKKKSWEQFCLWTNLQNFPIHVIRALYIEVFLYPTLIIQASSRLKRSANHLWNNSDICRKKFGEWSPLKNHKSYEMTFVKLETFCIIPISHPGTNFYRLRWPLVLPVLNTPTQRFKDNKQKAMIIINAYSSMLTSNYHLNLALI